MTSDALSLRTKLTIIIAFSHYAVQMGDGIRRIRNVLPFFVALVAVAGLLYIEPHMSATVIIFGIGLAILLVAGMRIWYFIPLGILGGAAAYWYISTQGYANARIVAWINPFDPEVFRNKGWQGANSQTAAIAHRPISSVPPRMRCTRPFCGVPFACLRVSSGAAKVR